MTVGHFDHKCSIVNCSLGLAHATPLSIVNSPLICIFWQRPFDSNLKVDGNRLATYLNYVSTGAWPPTRATVLRLHPLSLLSNFIFIERWARCIQIFRHWKSCGYIFKLCKYAFVVFQHWQWQRAVPDLPLGVYMTLHDAQTALSILDSSWLTCVLQRTSRTSNVPPSCVAALQTLTLVVWKGENVGWTWTWLAVLSWRGRFFELLHHLPVHIVLFRVSQFQCILWRVVYRLTNVLVNVQTVKYAGEREQQISKLSPSALTLHSNSH